MWEGGAASASGGGEGGGKAFISWSRKLHEQVLGVAHGIASRYKCGFRLFACISAYDTQGIIVLHTPHRMVAGARIGCMSVDKEGISLSSHGITGVLQRFLSS